ncbi:MAG: hypothetical protein IJ747_03035, partial [Lachnospiraceae bacterium]|nr:hypothetical protein [Lachnospiraceae bacterium]
MGKRRTIRWAYVLAAVLMFWDYGVCGTVQAAMLSPGVTSMDTASTGDGEDETSSLAQVSGGDAEKSEEEGDFQVDDLIYEVISEEDKTVRVKRAGAAYQVPSYSETVLHFKPPYEVVVPATVTDPSTQTVYRVVEIGAFAFAGGEFLTWDERELPNSNGSS